MSKLVTIFGGSGFVGRYIARRHGPGGLARARRRAPPERGAVRAPLRRGRAGRAGLLQHPRRRQRGAGDARRGCGGELRRHPSTRAARTTSTRCRTRAPSGSRGSRPKTGSARLVQISAIGADPDSDSAYARTKAAGEAAVLPPCPDSRDPAAVDRLRAGGSVLQPLRRHDAAVARSCPSSAPRPGSSRSTSTMSRARR